MKRLYGLCVVVKNRHSVKDETFKGAHDLFYDSIKSFYECTMKSYKLGILHKHPILKMLRRFFCWKNVKIHFNS